MNRKIKGELDEERIKEFLLKNSIKILTVFSVFILFIFLSTGTMIYSAQQSVTEIKEISFQKTRINKIEIFLKIDGAVRYEIMDLNVPKKLAIEFSPIQKISVEPWFEIQDTHLLNVRVEEVQLGVARVVLDFVERMPDFKIVPIDAGYKIELLFEETLKMVKMPNKIEPTQASLVKKEEKVQEDSSKEIPPSKAEPNYYVLVKNGFGRMREPDIHIQSSFQLYGESGSHDEHYRLDGPNYIFDLIIGRFFTIKNHKFKGSLGFSTWSFKNDGNFQFSLPHPFISNSLRSLAFTESNSGSYNTIYVSPQVAVFKKNDFQIWTGPIFGYAEGKITSFEDIDFSDNFPFLSSDISITSKSFAEEKFLSWWWGISGSVEYRFFPSLSVLLELNYIRFSSDSGNLNQKINLSRYQLFLGLQYDF